MAGSFGSSEQCKQVRPTRILTPSSDYNHLMAEATPAVFAMNGRTNRWTARAANQNAAVNRRRGPGFGILEDAPSSIASTPASSFEHVPISSGQVPTDPLQVQVPARKRVLQDITASANNAPTIKRPKTGGRRPASTSRATLRRVTSDTQNELFDTSNAVTTEPKNKGGRPRKQPRAGPQALPYNPRPPPPVILPPRRSIRRAQMEAAKQLLPELNAELRDLHEASLQPSELPEDEELYEPSHEDHIAEALRDLGMGAEPQPAVRLEQSREEQQPRANTDGFVQLSQFLEESPSPETIAAPAGAIQGARGAYFGDGKNLKSKWMMGRMLGQKPKLYELPKLCQESNRCPHCKAYQYAEELIGQEKRNTSIAVLMARFLATYRPLNTTTTS